MKEAFFLIDQLICQNVTRFCIAPGARSAPLISVAARHPRAKTLVHFDERGLSFYALGFGKGAKMPAVIITTSGSAVSNLLPAVMEAHHSNTPLILITADRPPELKACGANQTTEQLSFFAPFVRFQADLPPTLSESYFRSIAAQAVFHATENPPGPVHLNFQVRDPYNRPPMLSFGTPFSCPSSTLQSPSLFTSHSRGAILIGEIPTSPRPILELAKRIGWPVFADLLSNARTIPSQEEIRYFDLILKKRADLKPDFVLHFGNRLTSKEVLNWKTNLHVNPYPFLQDPNRTLEGRVRADIASFCKSFQAGPTDPLWLAAWKKEEEKVFSELQTNPSSKEIEALYDLSKKIPTNSLFFLGNSLAIRNADRYFFPSICCGFLSNRGLSGSDGNIATAAGIADGSQRPVVAWVGDQAALHDLNSLALLHKTSYPVTLIVANNFGGKIFTQLPFADWPESNEYLCAEHAITFEKAAETFNLPYLSFENIFFTKSALVELVTESCPIRKKLSIETA